MGIPLSNGEQTAHPTDIVMWIDTKVIANSLTKDDASYHNSSQIWIRTYGTFKKPNPKYCGETGKIYLRERRFRCGYGKEATVGSDVGSVSKQERSTIDGLAHVRTSSCRSVHKVRTSSFRSVHKAIVRIFRCSRIAHCNHFCFQVTPT